MIKEETITQKADFVTTREVAARLGVARETVIAWIRRGIITPADYIQPGGRKILIRRSALKRLMLPDATPGTAPAKRRRLTPSAGEKERNAHAMRELQTKLGKK